MVELPKVETLTRLGIGWTKIIAFGDEGGVKRSKYLLSLYPTIQLTLRDKLEAGYPVEERAKQLIKEGKIYN